MAFAGARLDVAALPLPPTVRHKLQLAGFRTTADLEGIQPLDLANGEIAFTTPFNTLFYFSTSQH
jgi:hypothetical protein